MSNVESALSCARRTICQIPAQHIMRLDIADGLLHGAINSPKGGRDQRHMNIPGPPLDPKFPLSPVFTLSTADNCHGMQLQVCLPGALSKG